jgi:hypothetical protein
VSVIVNQLARTHIPCSFADRDLFMRHNKAILGHVVQPARIQPSARLDPLIATSGMAQPTQAEDPLSDDSLDEGEDLFIQSTSTATDPALELLQMPVHEPELIDEDSGAAAAPEDADSAAEGEGEGDDDDDEREQEPRSDDDDDDDCDDDDDEEYDD